jgi:membrane associated rhomboid family serine protease
MFPVATSVEVDDIPAATIALIFLNFAVGMWMATLSPAEVEAVVRAYGLVPATFVAGWDDPRRWLSLVSNAFLHGGPGHLLANMWALWLFGRALETRWGAGRFVAFYLACGVAAGLTHVTFNTDSAVPAVGASGAIAGVLAGFAWLHPASGVRLAVPILVFPVVVWAPALPFVFLWLAFQVAAALVEMAGVSGMPMIAWWAHIGGFAAGMILALTFARRADSRAVGTPRPAVLEIGPQRARTISLRPRRAASPTRRRRESRPATKVAQPPQRSVVAAAANLWAHAERTPVASGASQGDLEKSRAAWRGEARKFVGPWGEWNTRATGSRE